MGAQYSGCIHLEAHRVERHLLRAEGREPESPLAVRVLRVRAGRGVPARHDAVDVEGRATGSMWRTPALWGIGYTAGTAGGEAYLHDGRARTLEEAEQISSMKLQTNAPAREVAASSQLVMLTQRLGKNMNEFLAGEGVNPETAFLLGKDTNTFRETLNGLLNGSEALRLSAATDPETKGYLQELSTRFDNVQKTTQIILENLPGLIAAKRAQQQIFNDNEKLRAELEDLQSAYSSSVRNRPFTLGAVVLSAILTLVCLAGLAALYLRDSRVRIGRASCRERV